MKFSYPSNLVAELFFLHEFGIRFDELRLDLQSSLVGRCYTDIPSYKINSNEPIFIIKEFDDYYQVESATGKVGLIWKEQFEPIHVPVAYCMTLLKDVSTKNLSSELPTNGTLKKHARVVCERLYADKWIKISDTVNSGYVRLDDVKIVFSHENIVEIDSCSVAPPRSVHSTNPFASFENPRLSETGSFVPEKLEMPEVAEEKLRQWTEKATSMLKKQAKQIENLEFERTRQSDLINKNETTIAVLENKITALTARLVVVETSKNGTPSSMASTSSTAQKVKNLQHILSNDKVPKMTSKSNLGMFLVRTMLEFLKNQYLTEAEYAKKIIPHAFDEAMRERVVRRIDAILAENPSIDIKKLLMELAFRLEYSNRATTIHPKKDSESLEDFCLRLSTELLITHEATEETLPERIIHYILACRGNDALSREINRVFKREMDLGTTDYARKLDVIYEKCEQVDKLLGTTVSFGGGRDKSKTSALSTQDTEKKQTSQQKPAQAKQSKPKEKKEATPTVAATTKSETEASVAALQQNMAQMNPFQTYLPQPWMPLNQALYHQQYGQQQGIPLGQAQFPPPAPQPQPAAPKSTSSVFQQPQRAASQAKFKKCAIPDCPQKVPQKYSVCLPHAVLAKNSGAPFQNTRSQTPASQVPSTLIHPKDSSAVFNALTNPNIAAFTSTDKPRCGVRCYDKDGDNAAAGLIDSGSNEDALTLKRCIAWNIDSEIVRCESGEQLECWDGHKRPIYGVLPTSIKAGDLVYRGNFLVVDCDMELEVTLGTPFLHSIGLMKDNTSKLEKVCGKGNVLAIP